MKWKKFTIYSTTEAEDLISMMLNENGVEGVQIEDKVPLSEADTKGMFIDILPDIGEDDGKSKISFFLHLYDEEEADNKNAAAGDSGSHAGEDRSYSIDDRLWKDEEIKELLETVKSELEDMRAYTDIGEGRIEEGTTEDTDWRDNWKQFFKPIKAGNFIIKPTWEVIPEEMTAGCADNIKVIEIDPGTAFGTGSHETTQLCLNAIEEFVQPGDRVLDIGTGSGILGIGALKCGAASVMATELDEMCAPAIKDNVSFNGVSGEEFELVIGNVIGDEAVVNRVKNKVPGGYDIVIANILAPVIVMLAGPGIVDDFIKPDGIFITSGIIDTKLEDVKAAFEANPSWKIEKINIKGEWTSVIARRVRI